MKNKQKIWKQQQQQQNECSYEKRPVKSNGAGMQNYGCC